MARSAERAYLSLSLRDMQSMFMINSPAEVQQFCQANNLKEGVEWKFVPEEGRVYF
jgi:dsRNA-specific ribonuclease